MAEQLAELNKDSQCFKVFSFPIANRVISAQWGGICYGEEVCDTGIDLTGKKVVVTFIPTTSYYVWTYCGSINSSRVTVGLCRGTTGTVSGTINILVV
jgi:hypothetical protein